MTGPTSSVPANPLPDPYSSFDRIVLNSNLLNDPNIDQALKTEAQKIEERIINQNLRKVPIDKIRSNVEMALQARGIRLKHEPNILDKYPSYTYKIKFCVLPDWATETITNHALWQAAPKEVIAESGVTVGFNIQSFEIKNLCGPSSRIGLAEQISWKMTITEPYGLSLIDRLYTLTQNMGIANHVQCKYFIELTFTGYNEDGSIADTEFLHVYRVTIIEIDANSTEGGTTYELDGQFDDSGAFSNQLSMAKGQVKIEEVSTMGEFFDKLAAELNQQNKNLEYSANNRQRIEYEFKMPEQWRQWKLTRTPQDGSRSTGFNVELNNKATISFNKTSVQEILIAVMSMTEEGIPFVLGSTAMTQRGQSRGQSRSQTQGINLVPWIRAKLEYIAYNTYNNTYSLRITYFFSEYPTTRGYSTPNAIAHSQQPEVQTQRLQSFINEGRLNKVYNFIYTGLNTDILRFDLKLNNFWSAMQPMNLGENTVANFSLPPQVGNQSVAIDINNEYRKARQIRDEAKAKLDDLKNQAKTNKNASLENLINEANVALQTATQALSAFQNFDITSFEVQFPTQSAGQQAESGIIINNRNILNNVNTRRQILTSAVYDKIRRQTGNKDRYLEDVVPQPPVSTPLPISSYTTNAPLIQNISSGAEARADESVGPNGQVKPRSRGLLATTLDNIVSDQFVEIELEIRGDPYWLGIDNITAMGYKESFKKVPPAISSVSAIFGDGECAFVLFFVTGDEPNADTGYIEFAKTSWAFNGLYVATEVTSNFKDGKFTQLINAAKDAAMYSVFNDVAPINQPPPPVTKEEILNAVQP